MKYENAELEIIQFKNIDVITTSGDDPWEDSGGDTSTEAPDK